MRQLSEKQLPSYVLGSLAYAAVEWETNQDLVNRALPWYRHITGMGLYHLPFFLVMDIGVLIEKGYDTPFASAKRYEQWPETQRAIRLRYENELLGRLLQEPMLLEMIEFLQFQEQRKERHLRLLERLLTTFAKQYPRTLLVHPAHLRGFVPTEESISEFEQHLEQLQTILPDDLFLLGQLESFLDQTAQNVQWSTLLLEEDRFELQHWHVLDTEEIRIGCRQILEVERRLGEIDIRQLDPVEENAETDTAFIDETYYPTGGLTELTNRGSFENLVLSELIYIEEDQREIDLFDVRFIEGELLYYKRDAGSLRRKRRSIHFVIDLGQKFQLKTSGYEYQFSILTQGLLLRITRDLLQVFHNDSLHFHFHYLTHTHPTEPLEREMELMRLLLQDEEQHGWVHFHLQKQIDPATLEEHKRKVYALAITSHPRWWQQFFADNQHKQPAILGLVVHVATNTLSLSANQQGTKTLILPAQGMAFDEVVRLKHQIIAQMVGLGTN